MILTGAPSYTVTVPGFGKVTYHRGEAVRAYFARHIPEADHDLFEGAPKRLSDVEGIGPEREQALRAAGVETPEALADADAEALADESGLTLPTTERLQHNAQHLLSTDD